MLPVLSSSVVDPERLVDVQQFRGLESAFMLKRYKNKKVDGDWLNTNFPCMMACPAHTNAGRYVGLIAEGRFEEAYRIARDPESAGQHLRTSLRASLRNRLPPRRDRPSHFHSRSQAFSHRAVWAGVEASHQRQ